MSESRSKVSIHSHFKYLEADQRNEDRRTPEYDCRMCNDRKSRGKDFPMKRRLLVASGYGAIAERIDIFFSHRGYQVNVVHDGVDCVGTMQCMAPDALVLDWDLPWGGAIGVLGCLREGLAATKIPVVLLAERLLSETEFVPPVAHCFQMPMDLGSLFEVVRSALTLIGARSTMSVERVSADKFSAT